MTTEENKKFYELFPEVDICPSCGGKSPCIELKELSEFANYVQNGRLSWCLHTQYLQHLNIPVKTVAKHL